MAIAVEGLRRFWYNFCHRDFEFSFVIFGGNFCLRDFEFARVIFTIFWSMSPLREIYVDGLM